jgi:hypothetical protein
VDEQPPHNTGESSGDEIFPSFDPGFLSETPLPIQRATGSQPYRGGGQANPWLVGLAVAVVLAAISIIAFGLLTDEEGGTPGTTQPGTTAAGETTGTTGEDGTTGTTGTDGSTVTLPTGQPVAIVPTGDPIPVAELEMSSDDIGPLDFGDDGDGVLGRLAATFDEPTQDTGFIVGSGSWGECPGDSIRVVQWGPLNVVIRGEPGNSQFVSYRLDLKYGGSITSPTTDLQTLSGLRVGDTVGQLKTIYQDFIIDFVVDSDAGLVFELRPGMGGDPLLWGPVESQNDDALVTGIYSPDSCAA